MEDFLLMDGDSIIMIIVMIILTGMSGYFSATETAFSTFNRIRLKNMASNGDKRAENVINLSENYDKIITTVLIGNNIVNITLSTISTVLFMKYFADMGATLSTVIITIIVLIFGEISPKMIASENADSFVLSTCNILKFIIFLFTPLNFIFSSWKSLIRKVFKMQDAASITEEELITFVDEAEEDGGINSNEGDLIRSAIEFNDVNASEILTPRVDVVAIKKGMSMGDIAHVFLDSGYSRLPVYDNDIDDIIGILHEKEFFYANQNMIDSIDSIIQKPVFVSEHIKISNLLQVLKSSKCHMAVVVDEFGGFMGIVTMEDIIEELIGDVWDEHDEVIEEFKTQDDGTCIVSCSADIDDFFDRYEIKTPDDEDMPQTVNGWILMHFGNFPEVGDCFDFENLHIEITKIDSRRIEEIKVTKLEPEPAEVER